MRAGDEPGEAVGERRGNLFVDRALDQHAAAGRAGLAAVLDDGVDQHGQRRVEIGVGEDDLRRLAAQFHRDAPIVDGRGLLDRGAGHRRAGEGDVVNQRMRRERSTCLPAVTGDDVEHAFRNPGLECQLGHADGRERRVLGRLGDQRVAHGKRRAHDAGEDLQRIIPRDDAADHAMRLAQRQRRVAGQEGDCVAMDLVAGAAVEFVVAHGGGDVGPALADRLAGVARFERREFGPVAFDQMEQPRQAAAALDRRHAAPRALVERLAGGPHRAIDVGSAGRRDRGEDLAVGWRCDIDARPGHRVDLLAVDDLHEGDALGDGSGKMRAHGRTPVFAFLRTRDMVHCNSEHRTSRKQKTASAACVKL